MKVSYKRQIAKAITFRILGTIDTILIGWLVTGSVKIATIVAGIEVITKILLYFFHERMWDKYVKYGIEEN